MAQDPKKESNKQRRKENRQRGTGISSTYKHIKNGKRGPKHDPKK